MLNPNYLIASTKLQDFRLENDALAGRVIMITGATGGLGTCLSKVCASAGATVILVGRNVRKLERLYDALLEEGSATPAIMPIEQDKAGPAEYIEAADLLEKEFGKLDSLVHTCAELGTATHQMAIEHQEWARLMNVNLTSARLLSLYTQPLLMQSSLASVVFLLDHRSTAYWGSYGISKQAVHSLMCMLADETNSKLDVNSHPVLAINGYDPGPMRTPLRRRAFPGELESESPQPITKLGPLLWLISRADRATTGVAYCSADTDCLTQITA